MPTFMYIGIPPGSQTYTSGSGSFIVPAYSNRLRVRMWGGGASGAPAKSGGGVGGSGNDGGNSTFGSLTAGGGKGSFLGGTASGGDINTSGQNGNVTTYGSGGNGANTAGGGGTGGLPPTTVDTVGNPGTPYGAGGSGASGTTVGTPPSPGLATGGGGGAFLEKVYAFGALSAGSSVSYSVGAGAPGFTSGVLNVAGGSGANGVIIIEWDY